MMGESWKPLRDLPGRRDPLGHQGTPEPRVNLGCLELLELMGRRAPEDRKEILGRQAQLDPKEIQGKWGSQASRVQMAPRGRRESQLCLQRVWPRSSWSRGPLAPQVPQVLWAYRESQVPRAWMEPKEKRVLWGTEDPVGLLDQQVHQA